MRRLIYQANFCAECVNALAPRRVWWPRYFCDLCAPQVKRRSAFWRWGAPLVLLIGILGLAFATHDGSRSAPALPSVTVTPTITVSAFDAQAKPGTLSAVAEQTAMPSAFCGARTRRGTPCRRLVPAGQRCPQHRGLPSMLAPKSEERD